MQQDPLGKNEQTQKFSQNIPKLSAPDESTNHNLASNVADENIVTGEQSYNPFDSYTGNNDNAGYNENYNQGYYDYNTGQTDQANQEYNNQYYETNNYTEGYDNTQQ